MEMVSNPDSTERRFGVEWQGCLAGNQADPGSDPLRPTFSAPSCGQFGAV